LQGPKNWFLGWPLTEKLVGGFPVFGGVGSGFENATSKLKYKFKTAILIVNVTYQLNLTLDSWPAFLNLMMPVSNAQFELFG
jgi:hypothetical protein